MPGVGRAEGASGARRHLPRIGPSAPFVDRAVANCASPAGLCRRPKVAPSPVAAAAGVAIAGRPASASVPAGPSQPLANEGMAAPFGWPRRRILLPGSDEPRQKERLSSFGPRRHPASPRRSAVPSMSVAPRPDAAPDLAAPYRGQGTGDRLQASPCATPPRSHALSLLRSGRDPPDDRHARWRRTPPVRRPARRKARLDRCPAARATRAAGPAEPRQRVGHSAGHTRPCSVTIASSGASVASRGRASASCAA